MVMPTELVPSFRKRMLPLALVTGLLVGVGLPMLYARGLEKEFERELSELARDGADRINPLIDARPELWIYDIEGLDRLLAPLIEASSDRRIRIESIYKSRPYISGDVSDSIVLTSATVGLTDGTGRFVGRLVVSMGEPGRQELVRRVWILSLVLGFFLTAALYWLPVATIRKGDQQNHELLRQLKHSNSVLEERVASRTQALQQTQEELRQLGSHLVAIQEAERQRISQNLHDELGQTLTGLRLRLTTADALLDENSPIRKHLEAASRAVDEGVDQVRNLAYQLRPPALDELGLADALFALCEQSAARYRLRFAPRIDAVSVPRDIAEVLFRTAQEAFTNIARHADATSVNVYLSALEDGVELVIEDDGDGIVGELKWGLGLVGVRERLLKCGGRLELHCDRPDCGLRLVAFVPRLPSNQIL